MVTKKTNNKKSQNFSSGTMISNSSEDEVSENFKKIFEKYINRTANIKFEVIRGSFLLKFRELSEKNQVPVNKKENRKSVRDLAQKYESPKNGKNVTPTGIQINL